MKGEAFLTPGPPAKGAGEGLLGVWASDNSQVVAPGTASSEASRGLAPARRRPAADTGCSDKAIYSRCLGVGRMGALVSQRPGNTQTFPWRQERGIPVGAQR